MIMKKVMLPICLVCFFTQCNQPATKDERALTASEKELPQTATGLPDTVNAVCIWNNISVREKPDGNAKWLTAISLGEIIKSTQIIEVDSAKDNRKYVRVILADGLSGWSLEDFIVPESKPGAFLEKTLIYERPDLLTKTDESFFQMDIVAIKEKSSEWILVEGRRKDDQWLSEGWVKANAVIQDKKDIAFAKFASEALGLEKPEEKKKAMDEILNTVEFYNSIFYATLEAHYVELYGKSN